MQFNVEVINQQLQYIVIALFYLSVILHTLFAAGAYLRDVSERWKSYWSILRVYPMKWFR